MHINSTHSAITFFALRSYQELCSLHFYLQGRQGCSYLEAFNFGKVLCRVFLYSFGGVFLYTVIGCASVDGFVPSQIDFLLVRLLGRYLLQII